jgi:sugar phosphate permease
MQIPSGWLTDALGSRWMLALYVVGWSLATMGLGLAQGLMAIWTMRLVLGIAQAGAYPAAAGLLKRWIPYTSRGMANSSVSMGGRTGYVVTVICTVPLMLLVQRVLGWQTDAWRVVFALYGSLGLVWGAAFLWLYRDSPRQHAWCNDAEVQLIESDASGQPTNHYEPPAADRGVAICCTLYFVLTIGWILLVGNAPAVVLAAIGQPLERVLGKFQAGASVNLATNLLGLCGALFLAALVNRLLRAWGTAGGLRMALPLVHMLRSKEMWLICAINFLVNIGWIFLATWLHKYLIDNHKAELQSLIQNESLIAAIITAVVGAASICGGLSGGRATDVFVRRYGRAWGRRLPGMTAGMLVALMYLVVPHLANLWLFVGLMIVIAFTIDFGLGASWASNQDIGGRHVASVLGCGNMCGNLGAAFFTKQIGALADQKQWDTVFYIAAAAMALYSLCWLLFDASRPVVREESH